MPSGSFIPVHHPQLTRAQPSRAGHGRHGNRNASDRDLQHPDSGVSGSALEQKSAAYGIELGGARQRSDRFEEACAVLTSLPGPAETASFTGTCYTQPHPPICIGGSGERRTLRTAARFAQHWNFGGGTPLQFRRARDHLPARALCCRRPGPARRRAVGAALSADVRPRRAVPARFPRRSRPGPGS